MTAPEGWVEVRAGDVSFAVPPGLEPLSGTAVDSAAGGFEGDGLLVTFDVGRFGPSVRDLENEYGEVTLTKRRVAGRDGIEASFMPVDEPYGFARLVQVVKGRYTATIRIACESASRCAVADDVFDSIQLQ